MNDRFKFRVYIKYAKMMCYDVNSFYIDRLKNKITIHFDDHTKTFKFDDVVLEQSTGLKDKNGKLIYENDLIKCPSGIYRIAVDDFGLWTAIYKNNPFEGVGEWSDMVKEYAFNQNNVEIEIIGNIHENKDLLENEDAVV